MYTCVFSQGLLIDPPCFGVWHSAATSTATTQLSLHTGLMWWPFVCMLLLGSMVICEVCSSKVPPGCQHTTHNTCCKLQDVTYITVLPSLGTDTHLSCHQATARGPQRTTATKQFCQRDAAVIRQTATSTSPQHQHSATAAAPSSSSKHSCTQQPHQPSHHCRQQPAGTMPRARPQSSTFI